MNTDASDVDDVLLLEGGEFEAQQVLQGKRRRRVLGVAVGVSALACAGVAVSRSAAIASSGDFGEVTILADEEAAESGPPCSAPGENCAESKCCIDGGPKGYKCYSKNKRLGQCFDVGNCTKGVHKGEKEGNWDASGTFQLAEWACEELGEASQPACWSYDAKTCPKDHCELDAKKNGCLQKCSTLPEAGACWQAGNCMWSGEKCEDGCWNVQKEKDCSKLSRCQWLAGADANSSSCGLACHVHGGEEDCPHKDKCMWDGWSCVHDPCSAPGEDCRETKCCSVSRGGLGMKCVEKMEYWATCMDNFNKTALPKWSGEILGTRAFQTGIPAETDDHEKQDIGCAWAGQDCLASKICCNKGFTCNKKTDSEAYCVQAETVSTWGGQPVPLPDGWNGDKLGDWRGEYQVTPAPADQDMAGTSLYCIMAVVPDSPEMALMWKAKENNGSIFGCNATSVYKAWQTGSAGWDTGEGTVVNTGVFVKVMEMVKEDKLYLNYDWTVKADADCVFLVERLRGHLWGLRPPANTPIYLKNNHLEGLGNDGFLGAIEVFSKEAMVKFMDSGHECAQYLGTDSGEDGFFKGCMDALGVGFVWDMNMFKPNYDPATCTNGMYAAYHPIKYPSHWQRCWDIATGKMCQGMTYDCGGELDPPVNSLV